MKYLKTLLAALNRDVAPGEIAGGMMLGAMAGLIPKFNLLSVALWMVIFLVRVNLSMAVLGMAVFALIGVFTDPLAERIGYGLLTGLPLLLPLWTALYNLPVAPWTSFNNTLVLGNFTLGLLIALPLFIGFRRFVVVYRIRLRDQIIKWRVMQVFKASKAFELYQRFSRS